MTIYFRFCSAVALVPLVGAFAPTSPLTRSAPSSLNMAPIDVNAVADVALGVYQIDRVASKYGLGLNYDRGKTAAMPIIHGENTRELQCVFSLNLMDESVLVMVRKMKSMSG